MTNYYKKFKRELLKDILALVLYVLLSVGVVYWVIKIFTF